MPCTPFSRQKRARRADPPTTPTAVPDWTSLTDDLVRRVGDCLLATDDIDCYLAFRAVCHDWRRSATKDDHPSRRFHPSKWALLDRRDDVLTLVNVETGRFLRRRIPLLRDCFFVGATAGGLLLLGESAYPYQARVLNPFTGSLAHFKAPVPVGRQAREVAVVMTSSTTMRVFVSTALGAIMWADQDSDYFHKCDAPFPNPSDLLCMVPFAGNVYLTNRQGSVLSISTAVGGVAGQGQRRRRSAETISSMAAATIIPASVEGGRSYYLVESGGELFLVTRPWYGVPGQLEVHRVDTMRKALEPVRSIGNRALFLSHVRCLSVDADKFRTVEAGCIYFVDQIVAGGSYFECSFMTTVRFPDGVQQPALDLSPVQQGCFRPFSLTHAFANYCKFIIQYSELRRKMIDDDEDFSDDYGYSDEEDFSDDYESDDGGSSESDQ